VVRQGQWMGKAPVSAIYLLHGIDVAVADVDDRTIAKIGDRLEKSILIVDDNAVIRRSLRHILQSIEGWNVVGEAVDGEDGIAKAQDLHPDLIVLDMAMPKMNGLEAARRLNQIMPSVPLLMYSAFADKFMEREAFSVGVKAVISKASDMETLVSQARTLLNTA
jgi:DNA-binding NarL/FixJ family response regulator